MRRVRMPPDSAAAQCGSLPVRATGRTKPTLSGNPACKPGLLSPFWVLMNGIAAWSPISANQGREPSDGLPVGVGGVGGGGDGA
jgi:hypothetical protein